MEAITFIKQTHKHYIGKIDETFVDEYGLTYDDYYQIYLNPIVSAVNKCNKKTLTVNCKMDKIEATLSIKNTPKKLEKLVLTNADLTTVILEESCCIKSIKTNGKVIIRNGANDIECGDCILESNTREFDKIKCNCVSDIVLRDKKIDCLFLKQDFMGGNKCDIINCDITLAKFNNCRNINCEGSKIIKSIIVHPSILKNFYCKMLEMIVDYRVREFDNWGAKDIILTNTKSATPAIMMRNMTQLVNTKHIFVKQVNVQDYEWNM